jgi:chemotaxis protein MotA
MKASTPIGIVVGIVGILAGATMEGTPLGGLLNIPAILIIFGGIAGVSIATSGMEVMKLMPTLYKKAMSPEFPDQPAVVQRLVGYAERARKEGLLALEPELASVEDAFTKKGLQLVVDGTDPDLVREVLEVEIESMEARHRVGQKLFKDAGGYAPTIGVLGTVMGLLHVMQLLQQPEMLGPAIAGAFMATLYGVGSANVIFMPVAGRLATLTQLEVQTRTMVIEGILAIQAGENPRVIAERLLGYLPPAERDAAQGGGGPNLRAVPDPAEAQAA